MARSAKPDKKQQRRQPGVIGFAWYRAEEWDRLRAAAADPEAFDQSYEQWAANATTIMRNLKARGMRVSKVDVALAELQAWCKRNNRPMDGNARGEFATRQLPGMVHDRALLRADPNAQTPAPPAVAPVEPPMA